MAKKKRKILPVKVINRKTGEEDFKKGAQIFVNNISSQSGEELANELGPPKNFRSLKAKNVPDQTVRVINSGIRAAEIKKKRKVKRGPSGRK